MRYIWKIIELTAAGVLFFLAVQYCGKAKAEAGTISAFLTGEALDKKEAEEICAREAERESPVRLCFWGEEPKAEVACRETGNSRIVTLAVLEGNSELMASEAASLAWQENGCLVDTDTARELFGTDRAEGQILWCEEDAYTVQGTFESAKKIMMRSAKETDAAMLNAVALELGESKNAKSDGEQFLMRYGLEGEIITFHLLVCVTEDLLLLLPVILAFSSLTMLFNRRNGSGKGFCLLGAAAVLAILIWLLKSRFRIPLDMVPSLWSDFSFWETWRQDQTQNLLRIFSTPLGEAQLDMVWNMQKSAICSLTAAFAGILLGRDPL